MGTLDGTWPAISNDTGTRALKVSRSIEVRNVSETQGHNCNAGKPSILKPASGEIISDEALL